MSFNDSINSLQKENEFLKEELEFWKEENRKMKNKIKDLLTGSQNTITLEDKALLDVIHKNTTDLDNEEYINSVYSQMVEGYKECGDINLKLANGDFTDELH